MTRDEEELKVIYSALDDCRRLIAAGKVQRWDVVKWGVTVNVALAAVAAAIQFKGAVGLFALAVLVAFMSWQLMSHYNLRVTRARDDARHLVEQMGKKGIDYDSIVNVDKSVALDYAKGPRYDEEELRIFKGILITSSILPLLVALFRTFAD
jgi:uncharacterized membrane protein